ncbi:MAG: OmpA family protein [Paludibacteraceae bacterium]|nr:OmpA family protein [Paludibacteraceae bacterium]
MKKGLLIALSLLSFSLVASAQNVITDEETEAPAFRQDSVAQEQPSDYAEEEQPADYAEQEQLQEDSLAQEPAQEEADSAPQKEQNDDDALGAHPYDLEQNNKVAPEVSHWSLIGHIGFNAFDGDFTSEAKHPIGLPSAGLDVEYSFTPVWSMGLEYMYSQYTVEGRQPEPGGVKHNADTLLNGHLHKAGIYLAMDLANLMFPNMQRKIFSMHPFIGGGMAWYKRNVYYKDDCYYDAAKGKWINPTHNRGNTANYINADGDFGYGDYDTAYNNMPFIQAGIDFEFNINRSIALGVRGVYSYFTRDYLDGRGANLSNAAHASKNNDGIFDVTLSVRYKIQPRKYTHERNVSHVGQHQPEEKALKKIAEAMDENGNLTGVGAAALLGEPCHDTIIIYHDTVILRETKSFEHIEMMKDLEQYYYVYFENNKANIDDEGLITIQQVAERLQEDSSLYAIVTGYCDNTGSNKLNYALGDKRAANVVDELMAEHGINAERMYGKGMGKIIGRRSTASYSPNRRAAIRLVDRDTFNRMRLNLEEQEALRPAEETKAEVKEETKKVTKPLSESARPVKVNEYKQRTSEEVKVEANTTLSKLAREYYNNTYCWVYIYIANKEKIKNPNALAQGTKLTIPELTEEELRITKDESLVLFNNARNK